MDSQVWQIFEIKSDFYWKILIEPLNQIKIENFPHSNLVELEEPG